MHEFSIITGIVEIVLETVKEHQLTHVSVVELEVGQASGVVKEAMEFAWESAIRGTILEGAVLAIKDIPIKASCRVCHTLFDPDEMYESCPVCHEPNPEIIAGRELRVTAIET